MNKILTYIKKISIFCLIHCICASASIAADLPNINVDHDTHKITINGIASDDSTWVTLKIMKPGKNGVDSDISDAISFTDSIDNIADITLFGQKDWSYSYITEGKPGKYSLYVMYERDSEPQFFENCITIYPTLQNVIDSLGDITNSDELADIIDLAFEIGQIKSATYATLDDTQKIKIADKIFEQRNNINSTESFVALLNDLCFVESLDSADNMIDAEFAISEYAKSDGGMVAYEIYTDLLNENSRQTVINAIKSELTGKSAEEIASAFNDSVILNAIKNAFPAVQIKKILEIGEKWIGIDFEKYKNHNNQGYINDFLAGNEFSDIQSLKSAYEEAVSGGEISNGNVSSGGGGSFGGGGGSFGGSNVKVELPQAPGGADGENTPKDEPDADNITPIYNDLSDCEWAREAIEELSRRKIVSGVADGIFSPHSPIKREEFIKLLVLAMYDVRDDAKADFADVLPGSWYYPYVASGVYHGITDGIGNNLFGTGLNIRREDMAVMVYRVMSANEKGDFQNSNMLSYADKDKISDYATDAVSFLSENNIMNGNADATFAPAETATRAQAACIIYRILSTERS